MTQENNSFSDEQKQYLQGFMMGSDVARAVRNLPVLSGSGSNGSSATIGAAQPAVAEMTGPDAIHYQAQQSFIAQGKKLCTEEKAKQEQNALDMWDKMVQHAASDQFPKGTDAFLWKFHGLFYVAPAQDSFMCRLRIPGGAVTSAQFRGLAKLAEQHAGGYTDVTTRGNLQMREIGASQGVPLLMGMADLGLIIRGSGADNVRNVTANPTSGIDPQELIESLPLAKQMHHYILQHRDLYGLPRKFNISFDGGQATTTLEDTNDIGYVAVEVPEEKATSEVPAGIYFRLCLGGITGHLDFARDTGFLVTPAETITLSAAILRVFIRNGDRTNRNKARLKYLLDDWGFEKFLTEVEAEWGQKLKPFALEDCAPRPEAKTRAHLGVNAQKQEGLNYLGVYVPVGRLTSDQMRGVASVADQFGSGDIRLTVWQNLLITDVPDDKVDQAIEALKEFGLTVEPSQVRSGLVACTGNAGCKYAGANTKLNAIQVADYLDERMELDTPINIHVTGCHHSCAQHYIGDIGLIGANVEVGDDMVEGYHMFLGGGFGVDQGIGQEYQTSIPATEVPLVVEKVLLAYLEHREPEESFVKFTRRIPVEELKSMADQSSAAVMA